MASQIGLVLIANKSRQKTFLLYVGGPSSVRNNQDEIFFEDLCFRIWARFAVCHLPFLPKGY